MSEWLPGAIALVLVLEGLLPFISPATWRTVFERACLMTDGQIRFVGFLSLVLGLLLLLASQ